MNQQKPSPEHYQGVINRLSAKVGSLTVENSSLLQSLQDAQMRINELEGVLAERKQAEQEAKPEAAAG